MKFIFYQVFSGVHVKFSFFQVFSGVYVKVVDRGHRVTVVPYQRPLGGVLAY